MSKPQTRTAKGKGKHVQSESPDGSGAEEIEIVDQKKSNPRNSKAGVPSARPVPKGKAKLNFYGSPTNRVDNTSVNIERVATRSVSGIKKKRHIPDNGEDSTYNTDVPFKKKKDALDIEEDDHIAKFSTPTREPSRFLKSSQTGKSKAKDNVPMDTEAITKEGEEGNFSDDWNQEEMEIAFEKSRHNVVENPIASSSKRKTLEDDDFSDDPFVDIVVKNAMPTPPQVKKVYLEDFENFTVKTLPKIDGSLFKEVQDPLLRKQYLGLPALRVGYLLSWSTSPQDIPHIPFSQWPTIIPQIDIGKNSLIMSMITMDRQGRYINPSRASPLDVKIRDGFRGSRREAFIGNQPAVAVCTGYCTNSNIIQGKFNKSISVLFHGQEWERYCCFLTMIFNETSMIAQVYKSALTFSTLPESISASPAFSNVPISPLSGRRAKINDTHVERTRGALYFSDIVPAFDARQADKETHIQFDTLDSTFPRFQGEVPIGSCIAVGHGVSSYIGKKNDYNGESDEKVTNIHLATNVLFIIVFGTPY